MDENRNTNHVLVKWCGLLYDDCTWERKDSFLKQTTDAVGTADGIGDDKPSSSAHVTLPSATITPITPAVTDSNDATDSEKNSAAFFFHSRKRDSSSVNHAIAGVLCTELQLYRKRCARPVPLAAPLPIAASPNGGVEFGDFEKLLRGGGSGGGYASDPIGARSTASQRAKTLRLAEAAAIATGTLPSDGPPPTELTLHPYQQEGVRWLVNKLRKNQSGILGDQMGLGYVLPMHHVPPPCLPILVPEGTITSDCLLIHITTD